MNDIFISYAHMDDQALDEDQKGWITKFHRVLQVELGQLMGEPAKICLLYTSPSPRDVEESRMPSSA